MNAVLTDPRIENLESQQLVPGLMAWLYSSRRARDGANIYLELAWSGRRVDVVLESNTQTLTSFELKIGQTQRAIEQAIYNRHAFDRSFVVLGHKPDERNIDLARELGIGILVVVDDHAELVLDSPMRRPAAPIRRRILAVIEKSKPAAVA